jgi:hypothetical protein
MLAAAESAGMTYTPPATGACAGEIMALRGVWLSRGGYAPLYSDFNLAAYLAALGREVAGSQGLKTAILPVYSSDPIHFRLREGVFVSTGLLLRIHGERELMEIIRRELYSPAVKIRKREPGLWSACAQLSSTARADFYEIQSRLASQVAEYEKSPVKPGLRRRP